MCGSKGRRIITTSTLLIDRVITGIGNVGSGLPPIYLHLTKMYYKSTIIQLHRHDFDSEYSWNCENHIPRRITHLFPVFYHRVIRKRLHISVDSRATSGVLMSSFHQVAHFWIAQVVAGSRPRCPIPHVAYITARGAGPQLI